MAIVSAVVCVVAVGLFLTSFFLGTSSTINMLKTIFTFQDTDVKLLFLGPTRYIYAFIAFVTLVYSILVPTIVYVLRKARRNGVEPCAICAGGYASFGVSNRI